jgi:hypothetical protein
MVGRRLVDFIISQALKRAVTGLKGSNEDLMLKG